MSGSAGAPSTHTSSLQETGLQPAAQQSLRHPESSPDGGKSPGDPACRGVAGLSILGPLPSPILTHSDSRGAWGRGCGERGKRGLWKAGRVHRCSGAGEGRQGRGEAPGGVGSSGLDQAEGTVCARVPRVEMPGTSGPQARAQGASQASWCPAPAAAVMTENSDKVPIALVGPDDVEFCSPPVSTARGPQTCGGPNAPVPGLRVACHRIWEVGANSGAQMGAWGGAPRGCGCRGRGIPRCARRGRWTGSEERASWRGGR